MDITIKDKQDALDKIALRDMPVKRTFRVKVQEFFSIGKDSRLAGSNREINTADLTIPGDRSDFSDRRNAIIQIIHMYRGIADWGNQLTRKIINYRIGFVFPQGVKAEIVAKPVEDEEATSALQDEGRAGVPIPELEVVEIEVGGDELEFIQESVIDFNNLDGVGIDDFAKCSEFEGQVLVHLRPVKEKQEDGEDVIRIALDVIPWIDIEYDIFFNVVDGVEIINAGIKEVIIREQDAELVGRSIDVGTQNTMTRTIPGSDVAFVAFDTIARSFVGTPSLMGLINTLEDTDKVLADMRQGNKYFAHPKPVFKADSVEEASRLNDIIGSSTDSSWKLGDPLIIAGDFSLTSLELDGFTALENELTKKVQIISGGTNVPPQHLGFPELMSNRDTAENMMEPIANFAMERQEKWRVFLNEVFDKAIVMRNKAAGSANGVTKLSTGLVESVLTSTTTRQLQTLKDLKIPLAVMGEWSFADVRRDMPTSASPEEIEAEIAEEKAASVVAAPQIAPIIPPPVTNNLIAAAASDEQELIEGEDEQVLPGGGSA